MLHKTRPSAISDHGFLFFKLEYKFVVKMVSFRSLIALTVCSLIISIILFLALNASSDANIKDGNSRNDNVFEVLKDVLHLRKYEYDSTILLRRLLKSELCQEVTDILDRRILTEVVQSMREGVRNIRFIIKDKRCFKDGADLNVTFIITSQARSCMFFDSMLILRSSTNAKSLFEYTKYLSAIDLEEELNLHSSPPAVPFRLNKSYITERHIWEFFLNCFPGYQNPSTDIFGILQAPYARFSNLYVLKDEDLHQIGAESIETLNYLTFMYLSSCKSPGNTHLYSHNLKAFRFTSRPECFVTKSQSLRVTRLVGKGDIITNLLLRERHLCRLPLHLIERLNAWDTIDSLDSSLAMRIAERISKEGELWIGTKILATGAELYEELDGRVAQLLWRYKVKEGINTHT